MIKTCAKAALECQKKRYIRARIAQRQKRRAEFENVCRILCIQMNAIGDAIMTQPAWESLKGSDPGRRIDLLCRSHIAPLFKQDPSIKDILAFNPRKYRSWLFEDAKRLSGVLSGGKYDTIVDFTALPLTAGLCGQKNAPPSVGFRRSVRFRNKALDIGQAYDLSSPYSEEEPLRKLMVDLVAPLAKGNEHPKRPILWIGDHVLDNAKERLRISGIAGSGFVVIHPGAKWPPKQWPVAHWRSLIRLITKASPIPILVLGGPGDENLVSAITKNANSAVLRTVISNEIDLTAAIIKQAGICISNDSAPMHIAAAVGTKSIALFGPVSPIRSAPPQEEGCSVLYNPMFCSPCELYYSRDRCRRGLNFCMHAIKPEEVFCEAIRILQDESNG
jgi:ADP-heptose:LPS heptosyltransferase